MLSLNLENLLKIDSKHGLSERELEKHKDSLKELIERVHEREQGFYKVIDDQAVVEKINNFANKVKDQYQYYVVLGIGGSSLGTICLKESLKPDSPLFVIDNIDPVMIRDLEHKIDITKTLFIVVTKSGGTPETLSQYFYFRDKCDREHLVADKHFVFITDPEKGLLREIANEEGIPTFDVPPSVGGRFSVLTAVGLLPAKLIGIDIEALLQGARTIRDKFLSEDILENLPLQIATIQHSLGSKGKIMTVMMPYAQRLIRLADWYRQLLAESIGKNGIGLTPINALGVTDQHSQSQLYMDGPNDKLIVFIESKDHGPELPIPNLKPDSPAVAFLNNVSFNKLLKTEKEGTAQALTKNDRPNFTINVDSVNEAALGELFMLFEGSVAFLGELYGINAFDQPGVELSKNLTKELLLK